MDKKNWDAIFYFSILKIYITEMVLLSRQLIQHSFQSGVINWKFNIRFFVFFYSQIKMLIGKVQSVTIPLLSLKKTWKIQRISCIIYFLLNFKYVMYFIDQILSNKVSLCLLKSHIKKKMFILLTFFQNYKRNPFQSTRIIKTLYL